MWCRPPEGARAVSSVVKMNQLLLKPVLFFLLDSLLFFLKTFGILKLKSDVAVSKYSLEYK